MSGSAARFKGEGRTLGALLAVALLAGCGLGERLSGPEARINAARALEPSLQGALQSTQAVLSTDASAAESFSRQWSDRLRVRAVTCSRGYKPRFYESLDTVRDRLADVGERHDGDDHRGHGQLRYPRRPPLWMDGGELRRQIGAAAHGQGGAADPGDQAQ